MSAEGLAEADILNIAARMAVEEAEAIVAKVDRGPDMPDTAVLNAVYSHLAATQALARVTTTMARAARALYDLQRVNEDTVDTEAALPAKVAPSNQPTKADMEASSVLQKAIDAPLSPIS